MKVHYKIYNKQKADIMDWLLKIALNAKALEKDIMNLKMAIKRNSYISKKMMKLKDCSKK